MFDDAREAQGGTMSLRLTPFAFPADTTLRFVLLMVAIIGSSLVLTAPWANLLVPGYAAAVTRADASCPVPGPGGQGAHPNSIGFDSSALAQVGACEAGRPGFRGLGLVVAGFAAGIALVGLAIYWWLPALTIRRRRLVEIPLHAMPSLAAALDGVRRVAGVEAAAFLVDPIDRRRTAFAFGRPGRRHVALSRGLLQTAGSDPELFRAIVLHELAHIANRDLDRTLLTVSLWRAFVVVAVAPDVLRLLLRFLLILAGFVPATGPIDALGTFQEAWRLAALTLFVGLVRNHVLRARELNADVRAAGWGSADRLRDLFAASAGPPPANGARRRLHQVAAALRTHPGSRARAAALADPTVLTAVDLWDGLAVGTTATLAYQSITLAEDWLANGHVGYWVNPSWLLAVPLGAVCCILVSRAVLAGQAAGRRPRLARFAVGLGTGLAIGAFLDQASAGQPVGVVFPNESPPGLLTWLAWILLAIGTAALFVQWLRIAVDLWLPVLRRVVSPSVALVAGSAVSALVLGCWLLPVLLFPAAVALGQQVALPGLPEVAVIGSTAILLPPLEFPLGLAGFTAFVTAQWAIPFTALLLGRDGAGASPAWGLLGAIPPARPAVRPAAAARTGLIAGAAASGVLLALDGLAFLLFPRGAVLGGVVTFFPPLLVPPLAMLVAAARGAWAASDARALHGLLAASVAALVTTAAGLVLGAGICGPLRACGTVSVRLPDLFELALFLEAAWVTALLASGARGWRLRAAARHGGAGRATTAGATRARRLLLWSLLLVLGSAAMLPVIATTFALLGFPGPLVVFLLVGAVAGVLPGRRGAFAAALSLGSSLAALLVGTAPGRFSSLPGDIVVLWPLALVCTWFGHGAGSGLRRAWRRPSRRGDASGVSDPPR